MSLPEYVLRVLSTGVVIGKEPKTGAELVDYWRNEGLIGIGQKLPIAKNARGGSVIMPIGGRAPKQEAMNIGSIRRNDSIQELPRFWDTHDLTDFEDELEAVNEPVFERKTAPRLVLAPKEIRAVEDVAKSKGVDSEELIREWVLERIHIPRA